MRAFTLGKHERGSVMAEYLIVLCLLSVGAALAIGACSALLLQLFVYQVTRILPPVP